MSYGDCSDCLLELPNGEGLCHTCVEDIRVAWESELNARRSAIIEIRALGHADVNAILDRVLGPHGA